MPILQELKSRGRSDTNVEQTSRPVIHADIHQFITGQGSTSIVQAPDTHQGGHL
jgi:hypothetical protein